MRTHLNIVYIIKQESIHVVRIYCIMRSVIYIFFFLGIPAFYTVRAVTNVEMFKISRKHLINAIDVPQIRDAIDFSKERPVNII